MYHYQVNSVMGEQLTVASWPPVRTFESIDQQNMHAYVFQMTFSLNLYSKIKWFLVYK